MARLIVGFDPSRAQAALLDLRNGLGPGVEWRVLNLQQNPNGVEPTRPETGEGQNVEEPGLLQRLAGWFGKDGDRAEEGHERRAGDSQPAGELALSEEELEYLRHAPARAGTVVLVTAPDGQEATVRMWSVRHGGFSLAPELPDAGQS
jgi:hypothetical protein